MNLLRAFAYSFRDIFRGRVFALLFLPGLGAFILWATLAIVFWDSIFSLSQNLGFEYLKLNQLPTWVIDWFALTPERITKMITLLVVGLCLVPLIILSSLLVSSLFAMPVVNSLVAQQYPDIPARADTRFVSSVKNSIWVSFIYLVLWIGTIPLWIVPGMTVAIPLALNGYMAYRIYAFDCLAPYATDRELRILMGRKKVDFLLLGFIISASLILPLMLFVMPIYSGLCFSHLAMMEIRSLRQQHKA